jgi:hypothetical protein
LTTVVQQLLKNSSGAPSPRTSRAPTPTRQPRIPTTTTSTHAPLDIRTNMFNTGPTTPTRKTKAGKKTPTAPTTPTPTFPTYPTFNGHATTMQPPFLPTPFTNTYNPYVPQQAYYGPNSVGNPQYSYMPPTFQHTYQQPPLQQPLPLFPFGANDSARRTAQGNPGRSSRTPSVRFAKAKTATVPK